MIFKHYNDFKGEWKWQNFTIDELSCKCCSEYYHDPYSLDLLQAARTRLNKPMIINSGHRCVKHNSAVGGRPSSQHLKIAFDIRTELDPLDLYRFLDRLYPSTGGLSVYSWGCHQDFRKNKARW